MSRPTSADGSRPTPKALRKQKLAYYGLEESMLDNLRSLDVDEALWRIQHELDTGVKFLQERTDFILAETVACRDLPQPRRLRPVGAIPIIVELGQRRSGTRLA